MDNIRVVIIEDDPMVVEINRDFVEAVPGFKTVGKAKNGKQGLEIIDRLKPDLVIVDIFMPEMDGIEFIREVRENRMDIDVIVISASDQPSHIQECMRCGIIDYLIKPFKKERLAHSLENYKKVRLNLDKHTRFNQEDIDSIVSVGPVSTASELPKGLNRITLDKIKGLLVSDRRYYTANEVAERVGVSRVTSRRYLEYLNEIGEVCINAEYGSVGRPLKKYKLSNFI